MLHFIEGVRVCVRFLEGVQLGVAFGTLGCFQALSGFFRHFVFSLWGFGGLSGLQ